MVKLTEKLFELYLQFLNIFTSKVWEILKSNNNWSTVYLYLLQSDSSYDFDTVFIVFWYKIKVTSYFFIGETKPMKS